jgi:2-polyprenyl-6-methoxyphenol hydroxylase-like FAD-dependent oxidoreductase
MATRDLMAYDRKSTYDVIVLGAGPAGASTALALVRMGMSTAILAPQRPNPVVGETVPPSIIRPLSKLGLWEDFLAARHAEATGILIDWGGRRFENDFLFNAYGPGWHLDRRDFDAMLLTAARNAGAIVQDCAADQCIPDDQDTWTVSLRGRAGAGGLRSRWLVDASGRCAWLGRRLGARRRRLDQLVALVAFVSPVASERRTLIEACETGWWYMAALPGDRVVVAYFADYDLLPRTPTGRAALWHHRFAETSMIAETVPQPDARASKIHCVAAQSSYVVPRAGPHWIAVGDAAAAWDPLSGQGIMKALTSSLRAADLIAADNVTTRDDLLQAAEAEYQQYLRSRCDYYNRETRWADAPFWRRRSGVVLPNAVGLKPKRLAADTAFGTSKD